MADIFCDKFDLPSGLGAAAIKHLPDVSGNNMSHYIRIVDDD